MVLHQPFVALVFISLGWGGILAALVDQPGYTDAYYYYNSAERLVTGHGFTDPYLWLYFNAPDSLPGPSHTYWMPLQSLVAAAPMSVLGTGFGVAQVSSVLCLSGMVLVAAWLGMQLGRQARHAWAAGLMVLFGGFYAPFWVTTDTFALYGLVGALALISFGKAQQTGYLRWFVLGGVMSGLAHLARADGVLLILVLVLIALYPVRGRSMRWRLMAGGCSLAGYLLIMAPWFARNSLALGNPLPLGGVDTIWMRSYDELVNYPPGIAPDHFFEWGVGNMINSRWVALVNSLGTFVAVETWVVLGPFALVGLWRLRRHETVRIFAWYAIALHLVMTLVFAFPGYRGGLFHSSAALLPFWAVLSMVGLDVAIERAARWRRWHVAEARRVFSGAAVVLAAGLGIWLGLARIRAWNQNALFYREIARELPPAAVLMVNDPPALYYHTGLAGVVVPNADPDIIPEIAQRYGVTYLVLDVNRTQPFSGLFMQSDKRDFLLLYRRYGVETPELDDDRVIYKIVQPAEAIE